MTRPSSRAKPNTERGTCLKAPEPEISDAASVPLDLLKWGMPSSAAPVLSASPAKVPRASRTSRLRWVSMR